LFNTNQYDRLLAVPFWIVERAREIAVSGSYQQRGEIGARRRKKKEKRLRERREGKGLRS